MKIENIDSENRMMTVRECATLLSVHRDTIKRAIKTGKLKGFKVGLYFRVKKKDWDTFIDSRNYKVKTIEMKQSEAINNTNNNIN